jgi:hypothetical protein
MKLYIGTKLLNGTPMNRADYVTLRGWELPADEDGTDEGYLVEYTDGGKANVEGYNGYVSWSPKEVFEPVYKTSGNMSFGDAIMMAKRGHKVARTGWNGSGMYAIIEMDEGQYYTVHDDDGSFKNYPKRPQWLLKTAQNDIAAWAPSGSDSLADDWCLAASLADVS